MHATAQVQAKVHGQRIQRVEPAGRGRCQVQGNDVVVSQFGLDVVNRLELCLRVVKANQQLAGLDLGLLDGDAGSIQCADQPVPDCLINAGIAASGDLQRRILTVDIWQGIDGTDHQHDHQ